MKKVMVFGAFDGIHPGHLNFFNQAKEHGAYLVVVVARDNNVKKFKGQWPRRDEDRRVEELKEKKVADKVLLGHPDNPYKLISQEKPDVICLGYDQDSYDRYLHEIYPEIKTVRLKPHKPEVYKSSKLNQE